MFFESQCPSYPGSRLDVQRHYLEDKRAGYAFMNPDPQDERGNRILQGLRGLRAFIANTIVAERRWSRRPIVAVTESMAGRTETAEWV